MVSPLRLQSSFITAHPSIAELSKRGSLTLEINDLDNILPLASDKFIDSEESVKIFSETSTLAFSKLIPTSMPLPRRFLQINYPLNPTECSSNNTNNTD